MTKKHVVPAAVAIALAALFLSFTWQGESTAADHHDSFYGSAEAGKTIYAYKLPTYVPCYTTVADSTDEYHFPDGIQLGTYDLRDGCQNHIATYSGDPVQVDFCVSSPGRQCRCWL